METSRYIKICKYDEGDVMLADINKITGFYLPHTSDNYQESFITDIIVDNDFYKYCCDSLGETIKIKDLKCKTPNELMLKLTLHGAIDISENSEDFNKDAELLKLNDKVKQLQKKKISSFKNMFKTVINDRD